MMNNSKEFAAKLHNDKTSKQFAKGKKGVERRN